MCTNVLVYWMMSHSCDIWQTNPEVMRKKSITKSSITGVVTRDIMRRKYLV